MRIAFPLFVLNGVWFCRSVLSASDGGCAVFKRWGIYCMGCGGTRAFKALLRLDVWEAFRYNPFLTLGLPFLIVAVLCIGVFIYKGAFPFESRLAQAGWWKDWRRILLLVLSLLAVIVALTFLRNVIPALQPPPDEAGTRNHPKRIPIY